MEISSLVAAVLAMTFGALVPLSLSHPNPQAIVIVAVSSLVCGAACTVWGVTNKSTIVTFAMMIGGALWLKSMWGEWGGVNITWMTFMTAGTILGNIFGLGPRRKEALRRAKTLRVVWVEGRKERREFGVTSTRLVELVRGLDGGGRSRVSALRGSARIDFVGDAGGVMAVFYSADEEDEGSWSVLTSPGVVPGGLVAVAGVEVLSGWQVTAVASAVIAARGFVRAGEAASGVEWYCSADMWEWRGVLVSGDEGGQIGTHAASPLN